MQWKANYIDISSLNPLSKVAGLHKVWKTVLFFVVLSANDRQSFAFPYPPAGNSCPTAKLDVWWNAGSEFFCLKYHTIFLILSSDFWLSWPLFSWLFLLFSHCFAKLYLKVTFDPWVKSIQSCEYLITFTSYDSQWAQFLYIETCCPGWMLEILARIGSLRVTLATVSSIAVG